MLYLTATFPPAAYIHHRLSTSSNCSTISMIKETPSQVKKTPLRTCPRFYMIRMSKKDIGVYPLCLFSPSRCPTPRLLYFTNRLRGYRCDVCAPASLCYVRVASLCYIRYIRASSCGSRCATRSCVICAWVLICYLRLLLCYVIQP